MQAALAGLVDFVSAHREWALAIAFLLALGETIAFISILIPSTAIMVGLGGLVAAGGLDFSPLWIGASLGALLGSTFSYWLGGRYGSLMLGVWPLSREPEMVASGTAAFAKWGAAAIVVGHFFGPLRSVVFLVAGISAMSVRAFQLANVPSAIAWAFIMPKSGEIGGNVLVHLWRSLFGT